MRNIARSGGVMGNNARSGLQVLESASTARLQVMLNQKYCIIVSTVQVSYLKLEQLINNKVHRIRPESVVGSCTRG